MTNLVQSHKEKMIHLNKLHKAYTKLTKQYHLTVQSTEKENLLKIMSELEESIINLSYNMLKVN